MANFNSNMAMMKISASFSPWDGRLLGFYLSAVIHMLAQPWNSAGPCRQRAPIS